MEKCNVLEENPPKDWYSQKVQRSCFSVVPTVAQAWKHFFDRLTKILKQTLEIEP